MKKKPIKKKGARKPSKHNIGLTVFKPTEQQIKWLNSAVDPKVGAAISEIAADCGVNRENWYIWIKNPQFKEWFHLAWAEAMEDIGWYLDKVGIRNSPRDYRYWEGMQTKYHKFMNVTKQIVKDERPPSLDALSTAELETLLAISRKIDATNETTQPGTDPAGASETVT